MFDFRPEFTRRAKTFHKKYFTTLVTINYLRQHEVITLDEADAILATENFTRNIRGRQERIDPIRKMSTHYIRVAHLYTKMYVVISQCIVACGLFGLTVSSLKRIEKFQENFESVSLFFSRMLHRILSCSTAFTSTSPSRESLQARRRSEMHSSRSTIIDYTFRNVGSMNFYSRLHAILLNLFSEHFYNFCYEQMNLPLLNKYMNIWTIYTEVMIDHFIESNCLSAWVGFRWRSIICNWRSIWFRMVSVEHLDLRYAKLNLEEGDNKKLKISHFNRTICCALFAYLFIDSFVHCIVFSHYLVLQTFCPF